MMSKLRQLSFRLLICSLRQLFCVYLATKKKKEEQLYKSKPFYVKDGKQYLGTDENKLFTTKLLAPNTRLCSLAG
jgi:hypothetical protein